MKKNNKKQVIVSQKLYPSQINELSICCFFVKKEILKDVNTFIINNGGRVISAVPSAGVARSAISQTINGFIEDHFLIFSMCQSEITDIFMASVVKQFKLFKHENGKAFVLDVLGFMGAKGPFVE